MKVREDETEEKIKKKSDRKRFFFFFSMWGIGADGCRDVAADGG